MNIKVNFYSISPSRITVGTKGSFGTSVLNFTFSEEWRYLTKKVTFYPQNLDPVSVIMLDDSVTVPLEVMKKSGESRYVISGYRDNKTLISLEGTVIVLKTLDPSEAETQPPTPSEMAQILEMMQIAVDASGGNEIVNIARAKEAALSAENAAKSANTAAERAENAAAFVDNKKSVVTDLVNIMNEKISNAEQATVRAQGRAAEAYNAALSAGEATVMANNAVSEVNKLINKLSSAYIVEELNRVSGKEIKNTVDAKPNYIKIFGKSIQENPTPSHTNPSPVINVSSPKITFGSKNIFTGENLVLNSALSYQGGYQPLEGWCISDYMPVMEKSNYVTSGYGLTSGITVGGFTIALCFYNENRELISYILRYGEKEMKFKTPAGCRYVRDTMLQSAVSTYQLEPGYFSTVSQPSEKNVATLSGYTLCGLKNNTTGEEYYDTIEVSANQVLYTKRIGSFTTKNTDVYLSSGNLVYLPVLDHKTGEDFTSLCSITSSNYIKSVDPYRIGIYAYYAGFLNATEMINYLYQNPTTVYYPLRVPFVQDITNTEIGQQLLSLSMHQSCTIVNSDAELDLCFLIDNSLAYKNIMHVISSLISD